MNDFESRLRDVLDERSAHAPDAIGLADGARRRLRRRRTSWAVAAAAIVAAAVPLSFSQLGGNGGGTGPADDLVATTGLPPDVLETGYRAESWHDVTFEVPVDWGYGSVTAWCKTPGKAEDVTPVVTRPDTITPLIMCSPGNGYGVTIGSAAAVNLVYESGHVWQYDTEGVDEAFYPDDAWLSYWYDTDTVITVVSPDRATTERVVDSVEKIDGLDANECPVLQANAEATRNSTSDSFSICRYDEQGMLTASRRYIGEESARVQTAILSAPLQRDVNTCPPPGRLPQTVLLQGGGYIGTVVTDATCEGNNGFFMSGVVREANDVVRGAIDLTRLP